MEEEPKVIPARRWRDLLWLQKQQALSTSSSATDTKPPAPPPVLRAEAAGVGDIDNLAYVFSEHPVGLIHPVGMCVVI